MVTSQTGKSAKPIGQQWMMGEGTDFLLVKWAKQGILERAQLGIHTYYVIGFIHGFKSMGQEGGPFG
jgi:hypothetical protein